MFWVNYPLEQFKNTRLNVILCFIIQAIFVLDPLKRSNITLEFSHEFVKESYIWLFTVSTFPINNCINSVHFFTQSYRMTSEGLECSTQVIWITFMIILWFFYFLSVGLEEQYRAMFMFSPPDVGNGIT